LGYAQFPGFGNWNTFGLVVRGDQWGTIGTSNADGRTSTHEIGHCLGLYHTFQSGCGSNCSNSGDRICDTPPSFDATWGCSATQNTCSNDANGSNSPYTSNVVDQIENYMSYDRCQNMFSAMQVAVMKNVFNIYSQLGNLISASNLVATGTNPGYVPMACAPKADFCQENVSICEGNTVTFTDRSYNGPITSRSWTFQGGSPASSSDSIVTVTYNTEGIYNVTLSTGNSVGSNNKTINKVIEVLPGLADISNWRFDENFESQDAFDTLWTVDPKGGREWELTNKAAYTGNQSAFLNNYINGLDLVDNLITPSLDMTAVFAPKLYFKLAYAQKSATSSDILRLYYSYNCGNTWNIMSILAAPLMTSVSDYRTAEFFPADQSEWREFSYPISTFLSEKENLRFKFEFTSGGGNNIFLDDISLVSTTGIENYMSADNILVYPNPVKEVLYINLKNTGDEINKISVMDMSGREVKRITSFEIQTASDGLLSLDVSSMSPGVYFIQFSGKEVNPVIKKVIVQ
jgi:PKD repeat protein